MKKLATKYFLEFLVIVVGISISFYVEKQNAIAYKNRLKSESLLKLKENLIDELEGLHFDFKVHSRAKAYADTIYKKGLVLYKTDKDSLGFYLSYIKNAATVFVDNDQEYSALVNSGLIELIENRKLVRQLQEKYSDHKWYSKNNTFITDIHLNDTRFDTFFESSNRRKHRNIVGYWTAYKSDVRYLNDSEINEVSRRGLFHSIYANLMGRAIQQDSLLIKEIDNELNTD